MKKAFIILVIIGIVVVAGAVLILLSSQSGSEDDKVDPDVVLADECNVVPEAGSCEAAISKYYFDKEKGCSGFFWGGCGGVVPFQELEECVSACETGSGVMGQVLIGPTCPVERPGDTTCVPRPFPTHIDVYKGDQKIETIATDNTAKYIVHLDPGVYSLEPQGAQGGVPFPSCHGERKEVEVREGVFETVNFSCDTGIR